MRRAAALLIALGFSAVLRGDVITLPAASSLVGLNPFFSDVRVFNTSYTTSLDVTATYRCFIGTCPSRAKQIPFTLAPRESRAFDDMVAATDAFDAHDTGGGIEFESSGSPGQLVVTSRLYSTEPLNSVGMFIPALPASRAYASSVLTSIRNNPGDGVGHFRTNVGFFNPGDGPANVTVTIFDNGTNQVGNALTRTVDGHSGVQINQVFQAAGQGSFVTSSAAIVVSADSPLFSYASVLDNNTADPIFVVGAHDLPQQPITPVVPTATPTLPTPTSTPTSTPAEPTSTPSVTNTRTPTNTPSPTRTPLPNQVNIGQGTGFSPSTITITVGQSVVWVWVTGNHSTTSDTGIWDSFVQGPGYVFSRTFDSPGVFPYYCFVHGFPNGSGETGTVIVNLPQ